MNVNALIEMAWSDEATFSDIEREFGIKEPEVKRIMQKNLKPGSYRPVSYTHLTLPTKA